MCQLPPGSGAIRAASVELGPPPIARDGDEERLQLNGDATLEAVPATGSVVAAPGRFGTVEAGAAEL
jgi:hypothetical protein